MTEILTPASAEEAAALVREAEGRGALDIVGGGTRAGFGRPPEGRRAISTARLSGLVFHEPAEMTLRAQAGHRECGRDPQPGPGKSVLHVH